MSSKWSFSNVMYEILIVSKPFDLIKWFILSLISMSITTYLNVSFFSTITIDVNQGLKYLFCMILFENLTSFCFLQQALTKKTFILDFLKEFRTKLNQRILSANWMKIKLSDQAEIRRKIDLATHAIQYFIDNSIDRAKHISQLIMALITISFIFPLATLFIVTAYLTFCRFYSYKQSKELLVLKTNYQEQSRKLHEKYRRVQTNMFEYVIHHEKDKVIDIMNQVTIETQRRWFELDYLYDYLEFKENLLGNICTFLTILAHYLINENPIAILPLYKYLSTLTRSFQRLLTSYIRWIKIKKDYDLIHPILEEFEERINVEQINLDYHLRIKDLSFQYEEKQGREPFHLQLNDSLTFTIGESILITGKSGAGKSTFYDILNGSIQTNDYSASIQIDGNQQSLANLHSIEKCRTMVLQDSRMDYRSTIFSMITDIDEDQLTNLRTPEHDEVVWEFLRLVQIDEFVTNELKGNLDEAMENKLSGGQKTRLLLARALYRAHHRHSSMLILDEPDKGLPAETTVTIIENIMKWYRSKGILFLTLHTERAHQLNFDQVLHVENGVITKTK